MPRFVILEHNHPVLHWDLMLEAGPVLKTWRLARAPEVNLVIDALAIGDHRLAYLEYEGPVSGDRGHVKRWDHGEYEDAPDSTREIGRFAFRGLRVNGMVELSQLENEQWRFVWTV